MRIGVLSHSRFLYTTRRLVDAAKLRGHDVRVVSAHDCMLALEGGAPTLRWRGKKPPAADVVIPRLDAPEHAHTLAMLRHLELLGIPLLNPVPAMALSLDLVATLQFLHAHNLPSPPSVAAPAGGLAAAAAELGGPPLLLRAVERGPEPDALVQDSAILESMAGLLARLGKRLLLQKIQAGTSVRVLVVGGDVVAALRRRVLPGMPATEGAGKRVEISAPVAAMAAKAVRDAGLEAGAVDLLLTGQGAMVLNLEASPVLRGIERQAREAFVAALLARAEARGVSRIPV
ncbi:MAG: hypothetical protein IT463_03115 [Planctomycetes bacterium]|nr:hypothetical protein [Planctomycetota bacterium]